MIERAARAIASVPYLEDGTVMPWEDLTDRHQAWCMEQAKAVLAAIREPSPEMVDAPDVYRAHSMGGHFDIMKPKDYVEVWRAMIDAAMLDEAAKEKADADR